MGERSTYEGPPVNCLVMPCALHDLGCEVLRSATESVGHLIAGHLQLAQSKVSQLDVALRVKNHILWLEVPVDDPVPMEALECQNDLSGVKARPLLLKLRFFAQVEKEFAPIQEINHEVQSFRRLKSIMQFDDKWVIDSLQDHALNYV